MSGFRSLGDHETVEFKASNTDKVDISFNASFNLFLAQIIL